MLKLSIPAREVFDPETSCFYEIREQTIQLEHSLLSLSKWESKWEKPFLHTTDMTNEQILDYIRCMTITPNVDPTVFRCLTRENLRQIEEYIARPMTATTFNDKNAKPGKREIVTAEIIYYWMVACQIPFECQKWHLNRLFTLIRVCSIKNNPKKGKKMGRAAMTKKYSALNQARRQALGTSG